MINNNSSLINDHSSSSSSSPPSQSSSSSLIDGNRSLGLNNNNGNGTNNNNNNENPYAIIRSFEENRQRREAKLIKSVKIVSALTVVIVVAQNLTIFFLFHRTGLLMSLFLSLLIPYFGFEGARTKSARMLSSYYAFNIASIVMFIVISVLQGEALREMFTDLHITESAKQTALEYVVANLSFGALITILQIVGTIHSRELIRKHIVYDYSRYERAAFHSLTENGAYQNNNSNQRRENQAGLPEEYINALPAVTLPSNWKKDENDIHSMCVICQDDHQAGDVIKSLPCHHNFHSKCIDEWLHRSGSCPMCNQSVVELATREQNSSNNSNGDFDSPPIADVLAITIIPSNAHQDANITLSSSAAVADSSSPPKKKQ